jgi:hypothetical protein
VLTPGTRKSADCWLNVSQADEVAMPLYHFKVRRSGKTYNNDEGIVFDSLDGAWEEATIAAGEMLKDLDGKLVPGTGCSIEVQDEFFNPIRLLEISVKGPH